MLRRAAHRQAETDAKFVRFKAEVIAREARTLAHAVAETAVLRAQLAEAQAASQALAEVRGVVEVDKNGSFSIKAGPTKDPFNLKKFSFLRQAAEKAVPAPHPQRKPAAAKRASWRSLFCMGPMRAST
ncbi:hypothetical protein ACKKBG_A20250 [Auxenochlorella protothecoides x Auxenochlorella symbiontica]